MAGLTVLFHELLLEDRSINPSCINLNKFTKWEKNGFEDAAMPSFSQEYKPVMVVVGEILCG